MKPTEEQQTILDAMKRFPFDDERDLTMSFRFGKDIAEVASMFIQEAKDEKGFKIRGNPQRSSMVSFYTDLPRPKTEERCAILSRTNLALFEKALGLRSRGIPFSLEGNIGAILGRILDVYWLSLPFSFPRSTGPRPALARRPHFGYRISACSFDWPVQLTGKTRSGPGARSMTGCTSIPMLQPPFQGLKIF
jgi:hypothetical protein